MSVGLFNLGPGGGMAYTKEAISLFSRMTVQPSSERKALINKTLKDFRDQIGIENADCLYFFVGDSEQHVFLNWIKNAHNITKSGSPTFSANSHIANTGSGTGVFFDTNYAPATDGVAVGLDDIAISIYSLAKGTAGAILAVGINETNAYSNMLQLLNGTMYYGLTQASDVSKALSTFTSGHFTAQRTANNAIALLHKTTSKATATSASVALPARKIAIGGVKDGDTTVTYNSNASIQFLYVGKSLDSTKLDALIKIVNYYIVNAYKSICIIGDSTIDDYAGGTAVGTLLNTTAGGVYKLTDLSDPADTINQQKSLYDALELGATGIHKYVFIQIGLNDLAPAESAATALARYQALVDDINSKRGYYTKVIGCTMNPCRSRLITLYGDVDGETSYQKWLTMNDAIRGIGANKITGLTAYVDGHTNTLNDGSGNLKVEYESSFNDHIHENTAARQIIANAWFAKMQELK